MPNEKLKITLAPETMEEQTGDAKEKNGAKKPEKIFDSESFQNEDHDGQILQLDSAIDELETWSSEINQALAQSELERSGEQKVIKDSSAFSRITLKAQEWLRGKSARERQLAKMAETGARKELDNLEKGPSKELVALKEHIDASDKDAQKNLDEIRRGGIDPEFIADMEAKMAEEKAALQLQKEEKEQELKDKIAEWPVFQKQERINNLLNEYGDIEKAVSGRRQALDADIKKFERNYNNIKGEAESAKIIRERLQEELEILKAQKQEMTVREEAVKARITLLKSEKKEIDPFAQRLNNLGKTPAEINEEKQAELRARKAENEAKRKAGKKPGSDSETGKNKPEFISNKPEPGGRAKGAATGDKSYFQTNSGGFDDLEYNRAADRSFESDASDDKRSGTEIFTNLYAKPNDQKKHLVGKIRNYGPTGAKSQEKKPFVAKSDYASGEPEPEEQKTKADAKEKFDFMEEYKTAKEWAEAIKKVAGDMVGQDLVDEFNKKFGNKRVDILAVSNFFYKYLIKRNIIAPSRALNKVEEVMRRLANRKN